MDVFIRVTRTTRVVDLSKPSVLEEIFPGEIYRVIGTYEHKGRELPMITKYDKDRISKGDYVVSDDKAVLILHSESEVGYHALIDSVVDKQAKEFMAKYF